MKRIWKLAVHLYPSDWRKRYEVEFKALLDDVEPNGKAVFDVLQGAVQMQLRNANLMKWTIACAIAGLFAAAVAASMIPDRYRSDAVITILGASAPPTAETVVGLVQRALPSSSLNRLIDEYGLYQEGKGRRADALKTEAVAQMRKDIFVGPIPQVPNAFWLSYSYVDRQKAQQVTSALVSQIMNTPVEDIHKEETHRPFALQLLDAPSLPDRPFAPKRWAVTAVGLLFGGILGATIGLARLYQRNRQLNRS